MKMTQINRTTLKWLRPLIVKALEPLSEELGIQLKLGNATFSITNFTFKLEGALQNSDGTFDTKEREDFKSHAFMYGLKATDLDKEFEYERDTYTIVGFKPRSTKYPILGKRVSDGKIFKFPVHTVRDQLED